MSGLESRQELSKAVSPVINKCTRPRFHAPWPRWYQPPIIPKGRTRATNAADLIRTACAATGVTPTEFRSVARSKSFMRPRHAVVYVLHRYRPDMSLPQIARAIGRKCHSTIINSIGHATKLRRTDPAFADLVLKLEASVNGV